MLYVIFGHGFKQNFAPLLGFTCSFNRHKTVLHIDLTVWMFKGVTVTFPDIMSRRNSSYSLERNLFCIILSHYDQEEYIEWLVLFTITFFLSEACWDETSSYSWHDKLKMSFLFSQTVACVFNVHQDQNRRTVTDLLVHLVYSIKTAFRNSSSSVLQPSTASGQSLDFFDNLCHFSISSTVRCEGHFTIW